MLWIERYNRFYFADIQAVTICQTQTGLVWNILFGTGAGLLTLGAIADGLGPLILVWLAIFTVPLVVNISLGPTCSCHIYTAVSTHKMPCFNRLPKAIMFLQTIKPLLAEIQGEVRDEEIVERVPLIPPVRRTAPGTLMPRPTRHYGGHVHTILLSLLFIGAVVSGMQLLAGAEFFGWVMAIVLVAQFGMSIAAAARQSGSDIPRGLRTVTWLAFAHVLVMPVLFIIASVVAFDEMSRSRYDEDSVASAASTVRSMYFMINLLSMFFSAILCFTGRHLLSVFRNNYKLKRMAAATRIQTLDEQET